MKIYSWASPSTTQLTHNVATAIFTNTVQAAAPSMWVTTLGLPQDTSGSRAATASKIDSSRKKPSQNAVKSVDNVFHRARLAVAAWHKFFENLNRALKNLTTTKELQCFCSKASYALPDRFEIRVQKKVSTIVGSKLTLDKVVLQL